MPWNKPVQTSKWQFSAIENNKMQPLGINKINTNTDTKLRFFELYVFTNFYVILSGVWGLGFGVWGLGFGVWEIGRAHV